MRSLYVPAGAELLECGTGSSGRVHRIVGWRRTVYLGLLASLPGVLATERASQGIRTGEGTIQRRQWAPRQWSENNGTAYPSHLKPITAPQVRLCAQLCGDHHLALFGQHRRPHPVSPRGDLPISIVSRGVQVGQRGLAVGRAAHVTALGTVAATTPASRPLCRGRWLRGHTNGSPPFRRPRRRLAPRSGGCTAAGHAPLTGPVPPAGPWPCTPPRRPAPWGGRRSSPGRARNARRQAAPTARPSPRPRR